MSAHTPSASSAPEIKVVATNRKARHDYDIEQTYEAGIALVGSEVKVLRSGKASLQDAYGVVRGAEIFVHGMHIPEYFEASYNNHEPTRVRKLLLHGGEIAKLRAKTEQGGYTLVPLKLYFKGNRVKVELALAKGRKKWDKREAIAKRDAQREMDKARGARR
jgi:SsrA-binding protein